MLEQMWSLGVACGINGAVKKRILKERRVREYFKGSCEFVTEGRWKGAEREVSHVLTASEQNYSRGVMNTCTRTRPIGVKYCCIITTNLN